MPRQAPEPGPDALRQRAESLLTARSPSPVRSEAETLRLLHELQVHQVELELQNEALRQSELETKDALARLEKLKNDLVVSRDLAVAANRAKSAFLSHMSHELRTPLSGAIGMTQLALKRATDPKQIGWLQKSLQAADHLLLVINDILDISKIEADKVELEHNRFTLARLFEDLSSMTASRAAEKGLTLRFDAPSALANQPLWGDAMRLTQVLLNLVSNAVKFTESGIVQARVEVSEETPDELLLRFEVVDTGIGIAQEDQVRLFGAFEQVDDSISRRFGGTGLGLAISKRLVELMGGHIGVLSGRGHGSTFWFTARVGRQTPTPADG
jgi:signal transduction histidine kinase